MGFGGKRAFAQTSDGMVGNGSICIDICRCGENESIGTPNLKRRMFVYFSKSVGLRAYARMKTYLTSAYWYKFISANKNKTVCTEKGSFFFGSSK